MTGRRWACALALAFVAGAASTAGAEPAREAPPAAGAWSGTWSAGVDEARDVVSGETMLVAAYCAIWAILLIYVLRLAAQVRGLRRETEDLRRLVDEAAGPGAPGGSST